nr:RNA polymerase sigma factor WhiG [Spirochaetales bacterium]
VLEVTESRISQLHTKAILRLRARLTHYRKGIV